MHASHYFINNCFNMIIDAGGGLARIVGTLTGEFYTVYSSCIYSVTLILTLGQPSISFSPPGLGLSYRKYSTKTKDGKVIKVSNKGAVHHRSVAVITELDW